MKKHYEIEEPKFLHEDPEMAKAAIVGEIDEACRDACRDAFKQAIENGFSFSYIDLEGALKRARKEVPSDIQTLFPKSWFVSWFRDNILNV